MGGRVDFSNRDVSRQPIACARRLLQTRLASSFKTCNNAGRGMSLHVVRFGSAEISCRSTTATRLLTRLVHRYGKY